MAAEYPPAGALVAAIDSAPAITPTLWWLGHSGWALKYHNMVFYIDPFLSPHPERLVAPPLDAAMVNHADMILATHAHAGHFDAPALQSILQASPNAKLVLPKSAAAHANAAGIAYSRMTTTDSDLRVEYFKTGDYIRVYAVPSAHPDLDHTPIGGYPYLGYLIRCGTTTIYHAGDGIPYDGLVSRLRPYNVSVALIPISGRPGNFTVTEAAELAESIGAKWLAPMHFGMFPDQDSCATGFVEHMLFHRPDQRFKVFRCGEGWAIPEDEQS
jgi:L-ascorbate metabolism protein UlaG (beta-lactamase superfamily)